MSPELLRYSCQMALPGFGEGAQLALKNAKVLVVGAGGLGCPAAQYLTSCGVGTLGIADGDVVNLSNLHRQVLFGPEDEGEKKADIAVLRLQRQNPSIKIIPYAYRITSFNVMDIMSKFDIVVDCTDNFETRYLLNDACVLNSKPLVYGAIYQYEGQVALWNIKGNNGQMSPNYRDVFPQVNASLIPDCAEGGVIPTLAGIIGCMQANEVIKYVTKTGELLAGKMLIFDSASMQSRIIKIGNSTKTNIISLVQTDDIPTMTASEVKIGLRSNTLELLDIRTDQERDEIDIGGTHIEADELPGNWDYINNGNIKVLYCSSGKRSGAAVKMIKREFPQAKVFSLEGGLAKWF